MITKADLHMHSVYSDGTDDLEALLKRVKEKGIDTFALTDHDTVDGVVELERLVPDSMHFIRGIEFSTRCKEGTIHILGYGFDPENAVFREAVRWAKELRLIKLRRRILVLAERDGISFDNAELRWLESLSCPGRPHLAQILMHRGYVPSVAQAFDKYLRGMSVGDEHMEPDEAAKAIIAGGGIPVWAHPFGESRKSFFEIEEVERKFELLKKSGIKGIECYYSQYGPREQEFLKKLAADNGMYISGGSDYHGTVKPGIVPGKLDIDGAFSNAEELTVLQALVK